MLGRSTPESANCIAIRLSDIAFYTSLVKRTGGNKVELIERQDGPRSGDLNE